MRVELHTNYTNIIMLLETNTVYSKHYIIINTGMRNYKNFNGDEGKMQISELILLPYFLRNGSMVMAKKIVLEIIADSDSTTLKT